MGLTNTFSELNLLAAQSPRLDVTPRRRIWVTSSAVPVAAQTTTTVTVSCSLTDVLARDDGLIVDYVFGSYTNVQLALPLSNSIGQLSFGIAGTSGLGLIIDLATPTFTTLQPNGRLGLLFPPVPYLSARDIQGIVQLQNPAHDIFVAGQPFSFYLNVGVFNSAATANGTCTLTLGAFYRVVHSLEEG